MARYITLFILVIALCLGSWHGVSASPRPDIIFARQAETSPVSCRTSCELGVCRGSCPVTKRSKVWGLPSALNTSTATEASFDHEHGLHKRWFRLDNTDQGAIRRRAAYQVFRVNDYVNQQWISRGGYDQQYLGQRNQFDTGTPILFYTGNPGGAGDERAMSQQYPFFDSSGNPVQGFEIAQGGLHGCTCVVLVSKRGVWAAHFWESYTHGKPNTDTITPGNSYTAFRERFLDFILANPRTTGNIGDYTIAYPEGNRATLNHPFLEPYGPFIDPNLFNRPGDNTQAFIFTPTTDLVPNTRQAMTDKDLDNFPENNDWYKYGKRTQQVAAAIEERVGVRFPVVRIPYVRRDEEEASAKGKILFQFSPDADQRGTPRWRLFLEERVYIEDASP